MLPYSLPPAEETVLTSSLTASMTADAAPLVITCFGPMHVWVRGNPLPRLRSGKSLWLLALLALRQDRPVERDWLAATLWPDAEDGAARLRPVLSELRKALGSEGGRLTSPSRRTLAFSLRDAEVDVHNFDAAISAGTLPALEYAAALYQGPLLEGCTDDWVAPERTAREQDYLRALETLADAAFTSENWRLAVEYAQHVVTLDPWRDRMRRLLMESLARGGDINAALQVYRQFVALLRDTPGAVPDAETKELYERLRARALQPARGADQGAVKTGPIAQGHLPHPLTDLVGRQEEREALVDLLQDARLVTLTGPGGIGKTRLASAVAEDVVPEFSDGVWFVPLESVSEGERFPAQIAAVFGLKEASGRPLLQVLEDYLRDRTILLVLDNCEHLLDVMVQTVSQLLQECAKVRILATSREPLRITGESVWVVPPLSLPDLAYLPMKQADVAQVIGGFASVQLFAQRAKAVQQTFALNKDNAPLVAKVCTHLDGIPLALELAAARVRAMTVGQMAERLDDFLGLLTGGSRAALLRQQTMRGTLDWSYALLSVPEQLLLNRLSVFSGGWTLAAAEEICADEGIPASQVLELLTGLVDKSLVVFSEAASSPGIGSGGRYRQLEVVRQYAAERLKASGDTKTLLARHRNWFTVFAAADDLPSAPTKEMHLRRVETELGNLRTALARSFDANSDTDAQQALRLAAAMAPFWRMRGHLSEARVAFDHALNQIGADARTTVRARALSRAADIAHTQGEYAASESFASEALAISRERNDPAGIADALIRLWGVASSRGDFARALVLAEEGLSFSRRSGDKALIATALGHLGNANRLQGDYAAAQILLEESLRLNRELNDAKAIAGTLSYLGSILRLQGQHAQAHSVLEESVELRKTLGDKRGLATSLSALGSVALWLGNFEQARAIYEQSLQIRREIGDPSRIGWALFNLGMVAYGMGQAAEARSLFAESLRIFRQLGSRVYVAGALTNLGRATVAQGDLEAARQILTEGLELHRELAYKEAIMEDLMIAAELQIAYGRTANAVRLWGAAHSLRGIIGIGMALWEEEAYAAQTAAATAKIGSTAFSAAWEEGLRLTWEQAVNYALVEILPDT